MSDLHHSVLLEKSCNILINNPSGVFVDATFGRGGHSREILNNLKSNAKLIAFDKDIAAVDFAKANINDARFTIHHGSFKTAKAVLTEYLGAVDGILMDLGVSSPQLDDPSRGFSFKYDAKLDMRMNNTAGITAAEWLSNAAEADMVRILYEYGEEKHAKRIAKAIVDYQHKFGDVETTGALVKIVQDSVGRFYQKEKNPATRTFQALRIVVNSELDELESFLNDSLDLLAVGGRLVIISFHSLEHRLVRRFMQKHLPGNEDINNFLLAGKQCQFKKLCKVITADQDEVGFNIRARSAQCRAVEKVSC